MKAHAFIPSGIARVQSRAAVVGHIAVVFVRQDSKRVGDFINRPPLVYQLLRHRILFKRDLGLR